MLGLPEGAPVYLDGASSGGSVALRVPGIVNVTVDGVIGGERSRAAGCVGWVQEAPAA